MIHKLLLPFILGGVGVALLVSLYWLNQYHRWQVESYLYAQNQTQAKKIKGVIELTPNKFLLLAPRLEKIIFLPPQDEHIKILAPHQQKQVLVNSYELHRELRVLFRLFFTQSLTLIALFGLLLWILLHYFLAKPLSLLTYNIAVLGKDPEGAKLKPLPPSGFFKDAEQGLKKTQSALQQTLHAQQRLSRLGLAVSKINHDIRGILTNAQLLSDVLLHPKAKPEKQKEQLKRLAATLHRAQNITALYLQYAQDENPPVHKTTFALAPLLAEVSATLTPYKPSKQAWQVVGALGIKLNSDKTLLLRILFNLGKNAFEASATKFKVAIEERDEQLFFILSDNGSGLPLRVRSNLFMPFVASRKGTGLGLSIAQELSRSLGGNLVLNKTDKDGTSFCLTLPHA